jgi:hypothetical protein
MHSPITFGEAHAEGEPASLSGGGNAFNTSRRAGYDCFLRPASDLFLFNDKDLFIRKIGYRQVNANRPTILPKGLVFYTSIFDAGYIIRGIRTSFLFFIRLDRILLR